MRGNLLLVVALTFIISLVVTLNLFFHRNYQSEMAQQFSKQQLMLASNISKNIQRYLQSLKQETVSLSGILADTTVHAPDIVYLVNKAYTEKLGGSGLSLKVYDGQGKLQYSDPPDARTEHDFKLLKLADELSEGSSALRDNVYGYGVSYVSPIVDATGRRKGAVVLDVPIDTITRQFMTPVKTGGPSHSWMMDNKGTLLYHPTMPEMVGKNLYRADKSCFDCHKSFEVEKRILDSGSIAVQSYVAPFGEDKIIASARIRLSPTSFWIACVSIPYSEVTASIRSSMRLHSILIVSIFGLTGTGAFMLLMINRKRLKAEEGARHEAELERYTVELESAAKKRTLELISEKEKLDAIVSSLEAGLFLADHTKKIIWVNKTLKEWLGEQALSNLRLDDIYGGKEVQSSITDNRMVQELVYHQIGNRKGYFQITSTPLAGPDGKMQLLGLIHDITEIKRFEEQMAHSEKLASLGRLTAGIAHEIGNPLTSVSSFLQILREMETDEFKIESLDTIMFHINRIADIVRQLSGLSKLPMSELKQVQVNDLVETSLGLLQFDKRARNVEVLKQLGDLPEVVTDANQLSQVFVNILLNAVDAMQGSGEMTITTSESAADLKIEFRDTGPGIPEDSITRLFDPFYTTKDKGTGLGLSVSYGIIKRLGGDIKVENLHPHGAAFTITIPKVKDDQNTGS